MLGDYVKIYFEYKIPNASKQIIYFVYTNKSNSNIQSALEIPYSNKKTSTLNVKKILCNSSFNICEFLGSTNA